MCTMFREFFFFFFTLQFYLFNIFSAYDSVHYINRLSHPGVEKISIFAFNVRETLFISDTIDVYE